MRLATIQTWAGPRAAKQVEGGYVDIHAADPNLPPNLRVLLEMGQNALRKVADLEGPAISVIPADKVKFHAPIVDPRKIICIGRNYRDHAQETGAAIPKEPILFNKFATALIGHGENIVLPRESQEVDYEAELVAFVGKRGRRLTLSNAMHHVAGYTIGHDVSARDWQLKKDGKQWMAGKTFDTFAPAGPVLVTVDEMDDPHKLDIRLRLNGQEMQHGNTSELIFSIADLVVYASQIFTLEPGDMIFTGTPPGVGMARKPPVFLKNGDVVEIAIEGLGILRNSVVAERE